MPEPSEYQYRVVIQEQDGRLFPLIPVGGTRQSAEGRLRDLLGDGSIRGWIERRPLGEWERCS